MVSEPDRPSLVGRNSTPGPPGGGCRSLATAVVKPAPRDPVREAFSWATWFLTAVLAGAMLFHVVRAGFGGSSTSPTIAEDDANEPAPAPPAYAPPSFASGPESGGGPVAAR